MSLIQRTLARSTNFGRACRVGRTIAVIACAAAATVAVTSTPAVAQSTPGIITYQGRIEFSGEPYAGLLDLRFTLFNAPVGGRSVGDPSIRADVPVRDGVFSATLDVPTGAFDGPRWLEVAARTGLDPFVALGPREFVSPAFASAREDGLHLRPADGRVEIGPVSPLVGHNVSLVVATMDDTPNVSLKRGAAQFDMHTLDSVPLSTFLLTLDDFFSSLISFNADGRFETGFSTWVSGPSGIAGDVLSLSMGTAPLVIRNSGRVQIGTGLGSSSILTVQHGAVGTDWGVRLENSGQPTFAGGFRLGDNGFLDVTNSANDPGAMFARLNTTGTWSAVSDVRRKTDVMPMTNVLKRVRALEPVTYRYRQGDSVTTPDMLRIGFIAQQIRSVFPSLVEEGDGLLTMDHATLNVVAIAGAREQAAQLRALAAELDVARAAAADEKRDLARLFTRAAELELALAAVTSPGRVR
ncbi:MAG: tail fiber domain-containing protein [Phycisphaerales bacterium]